MPILNRLTPSALFDISSAMHTLISPIRSTLRNFLPLREYFIENKWPLAVGLSSLLFVDFLQLMIPLVIKRVINALTMKTATTGLLVRYGMTIMAIAFLIAIFRYIWRILLFGLSRKVEEGLRNKLYRHLQSLSVSFYQRTKTGDLMARSINDLNAIRMAAGMGLVALTDGLVLGMAAIGFMAYIDLRLTLISLIPAPLLFFFSMILTRRMSTGYEKVQKTFSDLTERVREAFAGIRVVKAYGRESWQTQRIGLEGRRYLEENLHLAKTVAFFLPMMALFSNIGLAIVIQMGGRLTILGHITTGDFVAFIGYLSLLTWPMMAMGWVTSLIQRGAASMLRINRILTEVPEIMESVEPTALPQLRGTIEFRGLNFHYPGKERAALRDICLTIEAGKTVALVGRVGSGKSTLLQVIPRLWDIPEGKVFIDGVDICHFSLRDLRGHLGFVTQEPVIFSDTVRNNILFGRDGLSDVSIQDALVSAQMYEEVSHLEKGLDTLLGERGITLSGGQRQRLTIARALLADPHILILDDALSMVDTRTEERILTRVLSSRRGKINLIVSHRPTTISRADLILVLDQGRLVEVGDHRALLERDGEYARLYTKQMLAQELEIVEFS